MPRVLLLAAASLVAVAFAEGWARFTYQPLLDQDSEFLGAHIYPEQLNREGFRESSLTRSILGSDTRRILFLGDSFTFGSGVDDPSLRFTDRLEDALGPSFHLYNAGIPGSRPTEWVHVARALLPAYQPEAVVAVFFLRDGTDIGTSLRFHANKIAELEASHCKSAFYRMSHLARRVCDLRVRRKFTAWYLDQFLSSYLGSDEERRVWTRMQSELLVLRDLCSSAGSPLHLVIFPLLFGLDDYRFHEVEREILAFARRHDIPAISLFPGFEGRDERDLWVSPSDQHPNAEGHRVAAETLLPYLRKQVL